MNTSTDSYLLDNIELVIEAFTELDLSTVLEGVANEPRTMSRALQDAAQLAEKDGNKTRGVALQLMADACSLILSPDKPNNPFGPLCVGVDGRSAMADDSTTSEIDFFARTIDAINHPFLKARVADLVWVTRRPRDVNHALTAIESYTELPLDGSTWFGEQGKCWQRAINLSRGIGSAAGDRLSQIETSVIEALQLTTAQDGFFCCRLADTLLSNGLGRNHSTIVASKLESFAREFDSANNFNSSTSFYNAAATWFDLAGDHEKSTDMTVAKAEALIKEATARASSDRPSHGVAASFLEEAVQVYRSIPRIRRSRHQVDQRIQDVALRINEYGRRALDEIGAVQSPTIDLSESIEQARDAVSGKPLSDALLAFANLHSISVRRIHESAVTSLSRFSLLALIPKVVSSHDGRVIARTPGISGSIPAESDEAEIRAQMVRWHYQPLVSIVVQALILPALDVLTMEHPFRTASFIELARRSPIVPLGREGLFGKALAHGFDRDFATSLHLLSPQIEHMVRYHLKSSGVSTTHLDQEGIETENGLSTLIELPETLEIFGEDLTFEIKALFCDQLGPNLRNNIAHGLLDDQQSVTVDAVYAWWLGLKLVFNTFWNTLSANTVAEGLAYNDEASPTQNEPQHPSGEDHLQ